MCGVAGIWRFDQKVTFEEIKSFTDSMTHRGPDGAGYEIFEKSNIALGHRRLSILDLSEAGKQPMTFEDKRYWLTFNGEIYNFIEIRNELKLKGYKFYTETDSEVVLSAYHCWGISCFNKFNGMWAIAIWDQRNEELLLSRDRFGVKPLHYSFKRNKYFAFASETNAFKCIKDSTREFDENNLIRAINQHNVLEPAGQTIYKNINQLLPGSYLILRKDQKIDIKNWWNTMENIPDVPKSFEDQKEKFLELFSDACKIRLRSDVPVASALSGGIDSTAVYCMLNWIMKNKLNANDRTAKDWQKAFSITFPGSTVDEREYIQSVLDQTKGQGYIVEANNTDLANELVYSTRMSDFISGTPLACLTYVYKAMHENGIVVSMDGHGVDEYLYGYNSSVSKALLSAYLRNDNEYAVLLEETLKGMNFEGKGNELIFSIKNSSESIRNRKHTINKKVKSIIKNFISPDKSGYFINEFVSNDLILQNVAATEIFSDVINYKNRRTDFGEQQLLEEFHYTDIPYNLRDFDRGAMQHQIEIRMPFMDYRLVTYSFGLPQKSKLNAGFTKYILREAMKGKMPENIRNRKLKIGLGAPIADWFNGPLNQFLLDLAVSGQLRNSAFLNVNNVTNFIIQNTKTKSWDDHKAQRIWPIINYLLLEES